MKCRNFFLILCLCTFSANYSMEFLKKGMEHGVTGIEAIIGSAAFAYGTGFTTLGRVLVKNRNNSAHSFLRITKQIAGVASISIGSVFLTSAGFILFDCLRRTRNLTR